MHTRSKSCGQKASPPGPLSVLQRRAFSAAPARHRDHHFDTLKFVQRLKAEGFTEEQAEAMMKLLSDVIEERCEQLGMGDDFRQ
jgi:hypothetical protein